MVVQVPCQENERGVWGKFTCFSKFINQVCLILNGLYIIFKFYILLANDSISQDLGQGTPWKKINSELQKHIHQQGILNEDIHKPPEMQ